MILVTGTYPPERCGVADYSARLLETETAQKNFWKLVYTKETKLKNWKDRPAVKLDALLQHVIQILSQRIDSGGGITVGDKLTHCIRVIFLEEIVLAVVVHIAEGSGAGLHQDAILIDVNHWICNSRIIYSQLGKT